MQRKSCGQDHEGALNQGDCWLQIASLRSWTTVNRFTQYIESQIYRRVTQHSVGYRYYLHPNLARLVVSSGCHGSVFPPYCWLVNEAKHGKGDRH